MTSEWNEEQIAAYLDGAIEDPAEAERLRTILDSDPQAQAIAARIQRLDRLTREAFPLPDDASLPPGIQAALYGTGNDEQNRAADRVVSLPRRRRPRTAALAMAASVVVAVGALLVYVTSGPREAPPVAGLAPHDGPLHEALEALPSGRASAEGVQPLLTFRDGEGRICREFERTAADSPRLVLGVACRTPEARWRVEGQVSMASPRESGDETFAPASGDEPATLDPLLDRLEAGAPLSPDAEARLLRTGWKPGG